MGDNYGWAGMRMRRASGQTAPGFLFGNRRGRARSSDGLLHYNYKAPAATARPAAEADAEH